MDIPGEVGYEYPPLDQGMNNSAGTDALVPGELVNCRNFYAKARGEIWMREGLALWNSGDVAGSEAGVGLFEVRDIGGNIYQLKFTTGHIYYLTGGAWVDITGDAAMTGGQNDLWSICEHYGYVYATNGVDQIIYWDYTSNGFKLYDATNAPDKAGGVFSFAERLGFYDCTYGETSIPCTIHFSDTPGAQITWQVNSNKYYCGPKYGSAVVGVKEKRGVLHVLSYPMGTFKIYYTPDASGGDFTLKPEDMTVGCASGHTVVDADDWILFMGADGDARFWDTRVDTRQSIRRLTAQLNKTMHTDAYRQRNRYSSAIFVEALMQYWVTLTEDTSRSDTEHNIILALRIPDKQALVYEYEDSVRPVAPAFIYDMGLNYLGIFEDSNGDLKPVGIDYDGIVYNCWSGGGDNGEDVAAECELPLSDYEMPNTKKAFRRAGITFQLGTDGESSVQIYHSIDGEQTADAAEFTVRQAGVAIPDFEVGVHSIGATGQQKEWMRLSGVGVRSSLKITSTGQERFGFGRIILGMRPLTPPVVSVNDRGR